MRDHSAWFCAQGLGMSSPVPCIDRGELITAQKPSMSNMEGVEVKKNSHAPRFCKMCSHYKPPRSVFHTGSGE